MASACVRRFCQKRTIVAIQQYKLLRDISSKSFCLCSSELFNSRHDKGFQPGLKSTFLQSPRVLTRYFSTGDTFLQAKNVNQEEKNEKGGEKKPSLFQRFKQMYRDYWYVLVPVHLVTSAAWFGSFYYIAKSGVDVVGILESIHISDRIINPLRDSSLGYIAVAYALYKISTPLRYTVTLGGTTISIKYLKELGYIKPVPTREQLKEIYKEKKDTLMVSVREKRDELRQKKVHFKDKKHALVGSLETNIKKIKQSTDKNKQLFSDFERKFQDSKKELNVRKQKLAEDIEKIKNAKD